MIKLDDTFTERLSPSEQLVMLRLLAGADENGITKISYRTLAKACGVSLQVCRTAVQSLSKKKETEVFVDDRISLFNILKYSDYKAGKKKQQKVYIPSILKDKCKEREKAFFNSLVPFVTTRGGIYPPEMVRAFYNYWTERNKSGTKMRFELEKTWDISRRLMTWANNDKQYGANRKNNTERAFEAGAEALNRALAKVGG